nr:uncharacterized protein LOC109188688 isoform X2 [Ipomoea batatas]
MQGASGSRNGGQGNTTFKLKLRCDCRIDVGIPPKYVGGSVKWISDLDYDDWGIMTLWEKVEQFGYKRDDCRCFAKTDNGLTELVLDLEVWNLVNSVVDDCYTIENYKKAYSSSIHPMAGPQEWPHTDREPPLPPLFTTKLGRPRKLRKKSTRELTKDGVHISRRTVTLHCSTCKLRRNRAAQAEIPAAEGEVHVNVPTAEGEVQVNVATTEEDNVQDFVAAAADNDVQVNVAATECLVEVNVVVADDGDVLVEVAAHYGDAPVNVAVAAESLVEVDVPGNVVALYGDVPVNVGDFVMDFQQQQEVVQKKLALQI